MDRQRHWDSASRDRTTFALNCEFPLRLKLLRWLGRQTWLPRGQDLLLRMLCDPQTAPHFFFEIDFFGQRYRGDLAHYIDWVVFCYGAAPYSEVSLLKEVVAELRSRRCSPVNFFDVGANVGHHTLFMAPLADCVLAFEPFPPLRSLIEEKISLNALNNVVVVPFGLGERDETLEYFPGKGANPGAGTFLPNGQIHVEDSVKLTVRNGDLLCEERNFPRIDLLKVDVEGFEPFVFRGLANRIGRDRPVILTELTDASRDGFGSEAGFRASFYKSARFAEVTGRNGCEFKLRRFVYEASFEALIVPPEMAEFVETRLDG